MTPPLGEDGWDGVVEADDNEFFLLVFCGVGSRRWLEGFDRLVEKVLDYFVGLSRELRFDSSQRRPLCAGVQ
jgi:hypothetical protein